MQIEANSCAYKENKEKQNKTTTKQSCKFLSANNFHMFMFRVNALSTYLSHVNT